MMMGEREREKHYINVDDDVHPYKANAGALQRDSEHVYNIYCGIIYIMCICGCCCYFFFFLMMTDDLYTTTPCISE